MRVYQVLITILCLTLLACSALDPCQNKDLFIQKHKDYVAESIKHESEYSDEEWEMRDEELDRLVDVCYKNVEEQMSSDERKEFWKTNTKYLTLRLKKDSDEGLEALANLFKSFSGNGVELTEGLQEVFGDDFERTVEEFGDDLSDIFDEDFKEKLEEIFDEDLKNDLQDAFENLGDKLKDMGEDLKEIVEEKN